MAHYGFGRPLHPNGGHANSETATQTMSDADASSQEARDTQGLLARLERGEITRDAYLDLRVEDAILPFVKTLNHNQIDFMRVALRDQLESDPALVALIHRATELSSER